MNFKRREHIGHLSVQSQVAKLSGEGKVHICQKRGIADAEVAYICPLPSPFSSFLLLFFLFVCLSLFYESAGNL